jgi:hypothetical protein
MHAANARANAGHRSECLSLRTPQGWGLGLAWADNLGPVPSYVFATLGRSCHPNFAMPDHKTLIVDRQKV